MKKVRLLLVTVFLSVVAVVGGNVIASAHDFRTGNSVVVGSSQKIDHTLFVSGNSVDVSSEVFGDVYCAGQTVTVSGTVHGDIICAGQTVNITGKVDGDVRLAGQSVILAGDVKGNATIAGQTFNLSPSGSIGGDISLGSSDATLNGVVGRDIAVGGETVVISNKVGRDIKGEVEKLSLTNSARVQGNINYTSNKDVNKANGAIVSGKITRHDAPIEKTAEPAAAVAIALGWFIYWLLAMLLIAMALVLLFPRLFHSITDHVLPQPWKALLVGFGAGVIVPIIIMVLALTFVGLPLALLVALAWLVVLLLSGPVFAYYIGRLVLRNSSYVLLIMLVGAVILLVLYAIPVIGFLAILAALWIGSGAILLEALNRTPRPRYTTVKASNTSGKPSKK